MPPSLPHATKVIRLRRISHLLDKAIPIPGTKFRFGLDPILGLLPGGGDTITGALSAYIVVEVARMGVPRPILGQMIGNILLDSLVGLVPVLGDVFDVGWKSNVRGRLRPRRAELVRPVKNIALLEEYLKLETTTHKVDRLFLFGLIVLLTSIVIGFVDISSL